MDNWDRHSDFKISSGQEKLTKQKDFFPWITDRHSDAKLEARFPIALDSAQEEVLQKIGFPPPVLRPSSSFLCSFSNSEMGAAGEGRVWKFKKSKFGTDFDTWQKDKNLVFQWISIFSKAAVL